MTEISIKGIRDGLLAVLPDAEPWPETVQALLDRIDQRADFFKQARLTLSVGPRAISAAEFGRLRDGLSDRQVHLWAVLSDSPLTIKTTQAFGLNVALPATVTTPTVQAQAEAAFDPEEVRESAVLVRRTLRSGRTVRHAGHVIILGDVNPGADIVADGDVVVWGRLRGVVHAGAQGDEAAVICALDLSPTQLRIAGQIAVAPARKGPTDPKPEIARIKDGQIVAERWKPGDH